MHGPLLRHPVYTVSEKTTLTLHTMTSTHINRFWLFLAEMLLSEYAIEWCFVVPPLLTNVSALPWETWTPEIGSFQSCSEMTLLLLDISSTLINQLWYILYTIWKYSVQIIIISLLAIFVKHQCVNKINAGAASSATVGRTVDQSSNL